MHAAVALALLIALVPSRLNSQLQSPVARRGFPLRCLIPIPWLPLDYFLI